MAGDEAISSNFMKRYHRFYLSETPAGNEVVLDKSQSRHLIKALRLKTGDKVELFDKDGNTYQAEIISLGQTVYLKIIKQLITSAKGGSASGGHNSELITSITLATAIPKGARMDWLVEKCSELGLNKLIPIETKYSVTKDVGLHKIARWKKIVVESAKQSRQPQLMEITEILPFNKLLDTIGTYDLKLLLTPEGELLHNIPLTLTLSLEGRGC